jgi:polysaccharide export outer membrane protein
LLVEITTAGAASGARAHVALLLMVCTGFLAGCGASLNNELNTDLVDSDVTPVQITHAGLASQPKSKSESKPAASAKAAEPFVSAATPGNSAYKIGPQDVLEISVFKVPELSRTAQVAAMGTINLPLVGEVPAAGKTAREVERDLTAKLGAKYLQSPQVSVAVKEYNSQRVTIEGAVKKPGVYPVRSKTSLLQSIAMAQGLNDDADHAGVVIIRQANGKRSARKFDIDEIRAGRVEDPALGEGDIVVVSHSAMKAAWQGFLQGLGVASKTAIFF